MTRALGRTLGESAQPGDLVLLTGNLGAGKTCLTQGVLNGLGSDDHVRSPTFVLVMEHAARIPMYHADLYRLTEGPEIDTLGLEEYIHGNGLCVVEWANKAPSIFPVESLKIHIEPVCDLDNQRDFTITASGERHIDLLKTVGDLEADR